MVKIITHRASSEARQRAHKLVEDVRAHHLIKNHYKFFCRPIGSQKRRCIVQDKNGKYDLDFQIVLTKNSKDGDSDPTAIKKDFLQAFTDYSNHNERVEDSKTVVTVRCSKSDGKFDADQEKFSFDFVIISIDEEKRIRRNGQSQYTWVQLPQKNSYIYERFRRLTVKQQKELLETYLLPKIIEEKKKDESIRQATIVLFYNEINNYYQRNRLL
ncbi:MAG: hypothetical protein NC114_11540 [Ruminococcus flavefaciens]|nr:hypothetical protein [Ruminococcus flavefaciens]